MKTTLSRALRALLAGLGAGACSAQAVDTPAAPPAEETITLPSFTVSSQRSNAYRATDSMSAARIRGALIDTPATVNVITGDFLKDISAASLFDATQYVSGIGNGRLAGGSGILDRQTIRGYENDGRTIDNFNSSFQANLDPLLYERVEIVKGPNAILAPTGTPGGSINVITKSPQFTPLTTATLELGRFFGNKLTLDSTGPLAGYDGLAYRVVAGYQRADSFVDGEIRGWSVNPQLTWKIDDASQLTFKANLVQWGTFGAAQNPSITLHASPALANGATISLATIAPGFVYGETNGSSAAWSARTDRLQRASLEYTRALGDRVSLRMAAMRHYDHFWTDFTGLATPGQSTQGSRYNPYTGLYTPEQTWAKDATGTYVPTASPQYDPASITRTSGYEHAWNNDTQVQTDFAGNFDLAAITLQAVAGASYQKTVTDAKSANAVAGQIPNLNLAAPVDLPVHPTAYTIGTLRHTENEKKQVYGFARFGLFRDRLLVSGGVSRLWLDVPVTNKLNNTQTRLKGATNTPLWGALYKVTPGLSVYYSHSTNANGVLFNNQALFQEGEQDEFGVKAEFFNQRLSIGASHFDISQNNIVTPNPSFFIDPVNNPQFFRADLTNQGVEVDIVGGLTKNLTILASYTDMKLRDAFGRRRRNIPDTTFNALLKYEFREGALKGASVFGGVTHVGDQAGEDPAITATPLGVVAQVSFYAPARTIYNAGATYARGRYRFALNVDNVFDEETIWQPSGRFSLSPYPATNFRLTTTVTF
ncbi:MAG TPA: TonB-dependent receptor plug domain-containing protein [Opitutaceae bacterium]|nr:TonB-dependent receptor plug domain-containing protein [Opitutaceae bacterium]